MTLLGMRTEDPIQSAGRTTPRVTWRGVTLFISLLVFVAYASYALQQRRDGFNFKIYRYFSGLYWKGENPYRPPAVTIHDVNESYRASRYLDYSGAQLVIYNAAIFLTDHYGVQGLVLYSLLMLFIALILAYRLSALQVLSMQEYVLLMILLLSPYLWYRLFFYSYEDKAFYILLPLALLYARAKSHNAAGLLLGVASGLSGIAAALYPLLALSILLDPAQPPAIRYRALLTATALALVGAVLALLPFFPDSLLGWSRRASLEGGSPAWYSFLHLLNGAYVPGLNGVFILAGCLLVYALFAVGQLEFKTAIILVMSFFFMFSVQMGAQRIVPFVVVLVIAFRHRLPRLTYFAISFVLLLVFLFLDRSRAFFQVYPETLAVAQVKSIILLSPMVLGYLLIALDSSYPRGRLQT